MKLSDFNLLSFDCYGTLIDWDTGIKTALQPWVKRENVQLPLDEILALHGKFEYAQETATPGMRYSQILGEVLKRIGQELGAEVSNEDAAVYGESVGAWPPFEDTVESLKHLRRYFTLVILSNIDNASFTRTKQRLLTEFDFVFTAEDIGSYKPALHNFNYMREKLDEKGFLRDKHLHVAESLFHDHAPAQELGYKTCWIHRQHNKTGSGATYNPDVTPPYDFRFTSLAEMVNTHKSELANEPG